MFNNEFSAKGCALAGVLVVNAFIGSVAHAVDNRVPSFWGGVSVQVMETYGNNNSRALTGARVVLDVKDRQRADRITERYPAIRFPMERTSQTRGVNLTRIPPSNVIGEYTLIVYPPVRRGQVCESYNNGRGAKVGRDGSVMISLRKSPGPSTTRRTFNFRCSKGGSAHPVGGAQAGNSNMNDPARCHDVRVQGIRSGARYGSVTLVSCRQDDGKWKIEPYDYRR